VPNNSISCEGMLSPVSITVAVSALRFLYKVALHRGGTSNEIIRIVYLQPSD
jgi:hypothetical protein